MSTIANPLTSPTDPVTPQAGASTAAATPPTDPLASESTFLKLLVSQLQNQDPLDPVDSNQFVSQLTAYSQLEQLIGIHSDTTTLATAPSTAAAPATATAATSEPNPLAANQTPSTQTGAN